MNLYLKRIAINTTVLLIALGTSFAANADLWVHHAKITRTLNDNTYGGCMVFLNKSVRAANPNLAACPDNGWVSLDCDAIVHTQAQANAMWSSALVAFSLNKTVSLQILPDKKVNGYCIAKRFDIIQ